MGSKYLAGNHLRAWEFGGSGKEALSTRDPVKADAEAR